MKLIIESFTSRGFRNGDIEYSLNSNKNVNLFLLANGEGKTTTINLVKHALSGSASYWEKSFDEYKKSPDTISGKFTIRIRFEEKQYRIEMEFDFEKRTANYVTHFPDDRNPSFKFDLPTSIKKILNKESIELLFFDLAKSEALFDETSQFNARTSIEKYMRLDVIKDFISHVDKYKKNARKKNSSKADTQMLEEDLNILRQRKEFQEEKIKELKERRHQIFTEFTKKKQKRDEIISQNKDLSDQLNSLNSQIKDLELTDQKLKNDIFKEITNPSKHFTEIFDRVMEINDFLEKKRLPEPDAKALIEDILEDHAQKCICGRELDEETKKYLRNHSDELIGSESSSILNVLKTDLKSIHAQSIEENLISMLDMLNDNAGNLKEKTDELEDLNTNTQDNQVRALDSDLAKLESDLNKIEDDIKFIDQSLKDAKKSEINKHISEIENIKYLTELIDHREKELDVLLGFEAESKKINKLINLINDATEFAANRISDDVITSCNEKIRSTLAEGDNLLIESIDKKINLSGKSRGSFGQTSTIGYLFLITLSEESAINFPAIIDNPVISMDSGNRNGVANYFGKLDKQILIFLFDAEKDNFTTNMLQQYPEKINCFTKWGKKTYPTITKLLNKQNISGIYESDDSYIVNNQKFFEEVVFKSK